AAAAPVGFLTVEAGTGRGELPPGRRAEAIGGGEETLPDLSYLSPEGLRQLNEALLKWPAGFTVNRRLQRPLERRHSAMGIDGGIEWAHAETLAFATILTEGTPIRLT